MKQRLRQLKMTPKPALHLGRFRLHLGNGHDKTMKINLEMPEHDEDEKTLRGRRVLELRPTNEGDQNRRKKKRRRKRKKKLRDVEVKVKLLQEAILAAEEMVVADVVHNQWH
jgi:hypothetical protein